MDVASNLFIAAFLILVAASAAVVCIFQLPATIGRRLPIGALLRTFHIAGALDRNPLSWNSRGPARGGV